MKNGGKKFCSAVSKGLTNSAYFFGNFICLFFNQLYFLLLYQ
ncbi:hypothetical protein NEIMUCOT_04776 [Neisseria mucosa ATCC 25996]|uniref:Uncharacterized protein n=1 Tax=Neisseria mucosa (strain ATCC 25996 / DSM 4631 / NCTC 10774 / M26) TaxID=546266 RepID=D2ZVY4_NEIM2|nr:hypothetical protein NEIMUCOT_04776 [Neisseria mucosa ATCC 25996]